MTPKSNATPKSDETPNPPSPTLVAMEHNTRKNKFVLLSGLTLARVLSPRKAKKKASRIKMKMEKAALCYYILNTHFEAYMRMAEDRTAQDRIA